MHTVKYPYFRKLFQICTRLHTSEDYFKQWATTSKSYFKHFVHAKTNSNCRKRTISTRLDTSGNYFSYRPSNLKSVSFQFPPPIPHRKGDLFVRLLPSQKRPDGDDQGQDCETNNWFMQDASFGTSMTYLRCAIDGNWPIADSNSANMVEYNNAASQQTASSRSSRRSISLPPN